MQGGNRAVTLSDGRQVTVVIPPGAQHRQVLQLPDLDALYYNGGPRGPLVLTLSVDQDKAMPFVVNTGKDECVLAAMFHVKHQDIEGREFYQVLLGYALT